MELDSFKIDISKRIIMVIALSFVYISCYGISSYFNIFVMPIKIIYSIITNIIF